MDYVPVLLIVVGMTAFFNAAEWEARDGSPNHRILWSMLSLLISVLALGAGGDWLAWLIAQVCLFIGIAGVRVWLEDRERKKNDGS